MDVAAEEGLQQDGRLHPINLLLLNWQLSQKMPSRTITEPLPKYIPLDNAAVNHAIRRMRHA